MFDFIEYSEEESVVSHEFIDEFEQRHDIEFPMVLREYYNKYNRAQLTETCFVLHKDIKFYVDFILPLTGRNSVERQLDFDLNNEYLPKNFVPFACDVENEYYYWDKNDEKVYCVSVENIEHPIPISNSVEELFQILSEAAAYGSTDEDPYYPQIEDKKKKSLFRKLLGK